MKKPSSSRWLARHHRDTHVKKAQAHGYRSRAWFKIEDIVRKFNLFDQSGAIVDLGAAPGGWSQFLSAHAPKKSRLIACDVLPMKPIERVHFIEGNFLETHTLNQIFEALNGAKVSMIFSDMAANITGLKCVDEANAAALLEAVWNFTQQWLSLKGRCVIKGFQSTAFDQFFKQLKTHFSKVFCYKPQASRNESKEIYLVAINYQF